MTKRTSYVIERAVRKASSYLRLTVMCGEFEQLRALNTMAKCTKTSKVQSLRSHKRILRLSMPLLLWETPVRCTATVVALRVAACQRGACFEA
eukprot:6172448-Pleurochrysis_carterae.AAC.1